MTFSPCCKRCHVSSFKYKSDHHTSEVKVITQNRFFLLVTNATAGRGYNELQKNKLDFKKR